jgi:hypothetical protein
MFRDYNEAKADGMPIPVPDTAKLNEVFAML